MSYYICYVTWYAMSCYIMSCYGILCHITLFHVMLFCVILCYVVMLCSWTWHHEKANRSEGFYFESHIIFLLNFFSFFFVSLPFLFSFFSTFLLLSLYSSLTFLLVPSLYHFSPLFTSPLLVFFHHFFSSSPCFSSFSNNFYHHRFGDAYCENPQRIRVVEEVRAGIKAIIADFDLVDTEGIATSLML